MIGTFVRFRFGDGATYDEAALRAVAQDARALFEGMPGLRSKAFTLNPRAREACNFYVWESEQAARAFYTPEVVERIRGLYGVAPDIEFVEIATLVDNGPAPTRAA